MAWGPNNVSDPNNAPNPIEKPMAQSDVKTYYNRATATRRDTDKQKNLTITLLDVDTACSAGVWVISSVNCVFTVLDSSGRL